MYALTSPPGDGEACSLLENPSKASHPLSPTSRLYLLLSHLPGTPSNPVSSSNSGLLLTLFSEIKEYILFTPVSPGPSIVSGTQSVSNKCSLNGEIND